jgi:hypothetical protein
MLRKLIDMAAQAVSNYRGVTQEALEDIMTNSETLVGFKLTEEQVKEVIQMLHGQSGR